MYAELIARVRSIAEHGADWRINLVLNDAADALEAQQTALDECVTQLEDMAKRIEDLETALASCRVRTRRTYA